MTKIRTNSTKKSLQKQIISGKKVIFRYPRSTDAKELTEVINSLIEEQAEIAKMTMVTVREEKKWLTNVLKSIRKKEKVMFVVEIDGVVLGSCEITKDGFDVSRHVGTLGVGLRKEARGIGIGKKLVQLCLKESKDRLGIKMVKLYVFNTNKTARRVYEKIGFRETGRIGRGVFHNGRYKDDIIMIKYL